MGSSYAKNTVDDGVKVTVNVLNQASQMCQTGVQQNAFVTITGNTGSDIEIGTLNVEQNVNVDLACTQTSTTQNSISNSVSQTVKQIAKSIAQQFQLSSSKAENQVRLWTQIGVAIVNSYNQTCKQQLVQNSGLSITNNTNSTVKIFSADFQQNVNSMINCIQNDTTVNDIKNTIVQEIEQEATAIVESFLGPLIFLLLIILLIVGIIIFAGVKGITDYRFIIAIIVLIGIYLIIAYARKWFPFRT